MFSLNSLAWSLIGACVALLLGAWGGYEFEKGRFDAFKEKVEVSAAAQKVENAQKEVETKQATAEVLNAYGATINGIHAYYQSLRVQYSAPSGKMPQIPHPTSTADGKTQNYLLAPTQPADTLNTLEQCANTTAQLVALQDWVKVQVSIYGR